jgi:predicted AAA+ superfamily ATPase
VSGIEVDFVVDDFRLAVEAKATGHAHEEHLRGMRALVADHRVRRRIVVSLDEQPRRTGDGIDILPARTSARRLWADDLVPP